MMAMILPKTAIRKATAKTKLATVPPMTPKRRWPLISSAQPQNVRYTALAAMTMATKATMNTVPLALRAA